MGASLLTDLAVAMEMPKEESPDMEDTQHEDILACRIPLPSMPSTHYSEDQAFWDSLELFLGSCRRRSFYHGMLEYLASDASRPLSLEAGLRHAIGFVREVIQPRRTFYKIGITGHPEQRWDRRDCGYFKDDHGFTNMTIIWVSTCSHKDLRDSTGRFETDMVKVFDRDVDQCCINRPRSGGESPPMGSPQFCYVVWS